MCFSLVISLLLWVASRFTFFFFLLLFFFLFYLIARSLSLIFPSVSPSSSTLVCFFAVFVSIATSLCFLPRSSEPSPVTDFSSSPFLSIRLNIFHPFYTSLSFDSGYLATPFLIDFNLNAFCISSPFSSSSLFFMYFAFIRLNFHVEFLFLALLYLSVFLHPTLIFQLRLFLRLLLMKFNMASRLPTSSPGSSPTTAHIPVPSHFSTHPRPFGCKLNVRDRILLIFRCVFAILSEFTHPRECLKFAWPMDAYAPIIWSKFRLQRPSRRRSWLAVFHSQSRIRVSFFTLVSVLILMLRSFLSFHSTRLLTIPIVSSRYIAPGSSNLLAPNM